MKTFIFTIMLATAFNLTAASAESDIHNPASYFSRLDITWASGAWVTGYFRGKHDLLGTLYQGQRSVGFKCPVIEAVDRLSSGKGFMMVCIHGGGILDFNYLNFESQPDGSWIVYDAHSENYETDRRKIR